MDKKKFKTITKHRCPECGGLLEYEYETVVEDRGKLVDGLSIYTCIECKEEVPIKEK